MTKRDIYQEVTNKIIKELEKGALPPLPKWTNNGLSGLARNAISGLDYSGINTLLLWFESIEKGFNDPRFITYKQAQKLGGTVMRGEKGARVIYYSTFNKEQTNSAGKSEEISIPFLKQYCVFNVSQCEGLNLKPIITQRESTPFERDQRLEKIIQKTGAEIRYSEGQAFYRPKHDYINMPKSEDFHTKEDFYSTMFHELGHWTGHKTRINRNLKGRFGDKSYCAEELIAELTAAFLCAEHGVKGELRHAGYLQLYLDLLKSDKRAIFTAASKATKAAEYINHGELVENREKQAA